MKYIIAICDGMGDLPTKDGEPTPLAKAFTPTLDSLLSAGEVHYATTVPTGYSAGSDVANMSLLGYPPELHYSGRAPLEFAGIGGFTSPDQTIFRCNYVSLDQRGDLADFAASGVSVSESSLLQQSLDTLLCRHPQFSFFAGSDYRNLLRVQGALSAAPSYPPHDHIGGSPRKLLSWFYENPVWRRFLDESSELLRDHPVNRKRRREGRLTIDQFWPWGGGQSRALPSFTERWNCRGAMISQSNLLHGLARLAGLDSLPLARGAERYSAKLKAACAALFDYDLLYIHLAEADEAGHRGDYLGKQRAIEAFDREIIGPLYQYLLQKNEPFRFLIGMDHATPVALRTHIADPVPLLFVSSSDYISGEAYRFSEKSCDSIWQSHGGRLLEAEDIMKKLLQGVIK